MCAGVSLWMRGLCVAALTLLAIVATTTADDKRAEMSPMPFVLGSRYGRSQPRLISPRNDRFFMSSRYGKRSDPSAAIAAVSSQAQLLCAPTGVRALFRCAPAPTPAPPPHRFQHNRISTEERELGEDE